MLEIIRRNAPPKWVLEILRVNSISFPFPPHQLPIYISYILQTVLFFYSQKIQFSSLSPSKAQEIYGSTKDAHKELEVYLKKIIFRSQNCPIEILKNV